MLLGKRIEYDNGVIAALPPKTRPEAFAVRNSTPIPGPRGYPKEQRASSVLRQAPLPSSPLRGTTAQTSSKAAEANG
jgi:hypothetical protein